MMARLDRGWQISCGTFAGRLASISRDHKDFGAWHIELQPPQEDPSMAWDIFCEDLEQLLDWLSAPELACPCLLEDGRLILDSWITWPSYGRRWQPDGVESAEGCYLVKPLCEFSTWRIERPSGFTDVHTSSIEDELPPGKWWSGSNEAHGINLG